ncbi:ATP-dependent Clp protease ATP-binding subunit [Candidatus Saccharibacteria bacterium]|nr:ATP-dependent Clp protease ATP-binding subunit [Candidatus Saccharibacteria bacterium]
MDTVVFNYSSSRAAKARLAKLFTKPLQTALLTVIVLLIAAGIALLFIGITFGWFIASLAAAPAMLFKWWSGELKKLTPDAANKSIDGLLDGEILARLSASPTLLSAAQAAMQSTGGQFLAVRFGIGASFLQTAIAENKSLADAWQFALEIQQQINADRVSAPILLVAIAKTNPDLAALLAPLKIDEKDLIKGVEWFHQIQNIIAEQEKPKRTGGIARDFSFGWIPLLKHFGVNESARIAHGGLFHADIASQDKTLDQMINTFSSGGRQNITLVGSVGVGKTMLVRRFAEKLLDASSRVSNNLKFRQVIMLDASSLISAAPGRGEIEQLMNQVLNEAYRAKNIIVCLDDAQLFFEEGVGSVNLTNLLLPVLEGGGLRMILTMDEQRWLEISQRNPSLVSALNRLMVTEASEEDTFKVMQNQLIMTEFKNKVTYTYQSLREAYRLSARYVHDLTMPGRALKLLESSANYSESGLVTAKSVQQAIEQTMNVKVGVADEGQEKEKLLNMEDKIHERMINQKRAVKVVSDALRRARAGVRNENRPIGTFLFLGPTGVGKTELSKALGEVYFGGEDRLVRVDLNEYVKSDDVQRLIADGADNPNSLTAQVMKQPFSVVLLDEIEKAHDNVLNTLLQLLDEGVLRDVNNKEVSFRDAIIIATSNAGADKIRKYIDEGKKLEEFEEEFTNELIDTQQFKPEFLNRFDEIVVFRPLTKQELHQVIDLILKGVNKNLESQKVSVEVSDEAKTVLVNEGYDPRLGARPLRRVVQRTVENIVAKRMLGGDVTPGSVITISQEDIENSKEKSDEEES